MLTVNRVDFGVDDAKVPLATAGEGLVTERAVRVGLYATGVITITPSLKAEQVVSWQAVTLKVYHVPDCRPVTVALVPLTVISDGLPLTFWYCTLYEVAPAEALKARLTLLAVCAVLCRLAGVTGALPLGVLGGVGVVVGADVGDGVAVVGGVLGGFGVAVTIEETNVSCTSSPLIPERQVAVTGWLWPGWLSVAVTFV